MHNTRRSPVFLLVFATLAAVVSGGTADDPEVGDPAGDVEASGGGPLLSLLQAAGEEEAFDDVDLLAAWLENDTPDNSVAAQRFAVTVRSVAGVQESTHTWINFTVDRGPSSMYNSTADGTAWSLHLVGAELQDGPGNATATDGGDGNVTVTLMHADVGAIGGDIIANLTIERQRAADDTAPVLAPGESAFDRAPDEGVGRPFPLQRPPIVPGASVALADGTITEDGASRPLDSTTVESSDPSAILSYTVLVRNTGTDLDAITLDVQTLGDAVAQLGQTEFTLAPGGSATASLDVALQEADAGVQVAVRAVSERGAAASTALTVSVPGAAPPGGDPGSPSDPTRTPAIAGLDWLTPAAEATGTDDAFGEHAETVLLALLVLAAVLLLVLALALTGRSAVAWRERPEGERPAAGVPLVHAEEPLPPRIEMQDVEHDPEAPVAGQHVVTSATLKNNGFGPVTLRVGLVVDGVAQAEQTVKLRPKQRARVRFPWQAGPGANRVKVQVYDETS